MLSWACSKRQWLTTLPQPQHMHCMLHGHAARTTRLPSSLTPPLLPAPPAGFSGADLSNLVNEACLVAAKEGKDAISGHMVDYSYDKIKMGVERKSVKRSPEAVRRTAYHESGHAIVALNVPGAIPIHKATIVPRGHALGEGLSPAVLLMVWHGTAACCAMLRYAAPTSLACSNICLLLATGAG